MRRESVLVVASVLALSSSAFGQRIKSQVYVSGLALPVAMTQDPTHADTRMVVLKAGEIKVVQNGVVRATDFLDLRGQVSTTSEEGLLGLAFDPNYASNGFFYVYLTGPDKEIRIARFARSAADAFQANAASRQEVLIQTHPTNTNHNGATLRFGPDGYLYAGFGDGGAGNDPPNNAQNGTTLLGKMIRIDVHADDFPADPTKNYHVPSDNPFVGSATIDPAIWAVGYRNPYKFSFDYAAFGGTNALIVADVGQDNWEEVDYELPGSGGHNYGWRQREGFHDTGLGGSVLFTPYTDPIYEYAHNGTGKSITGGYVYRGNALGTYFQGRYFFGDYVTSKLWTAALNQTGSGAILTDVVDITSKVSPAAASIVSIDVDSLGELYAIGIGSGTNGVIYKLVPVPVPVTGNVTLGDWLTTRAGIPVTVSFYGTGGNLVDTQTAVLDSSGNFTANTTAGGGTYTVTVKASHWLRKAIAGVVISDTTGGSGVTASLTNGDVNGDNSVSLGDFNLLKASFGKSSGDPGFNPAADLNGDGSVSLGDFNILKARFGQSGD